MKENKKIVKIVIICTAITSVVQTASVWMLAQYISQTAGGIHQSLQQIQIKL